MDMDACGAVAGQWRPMTRRGLLMAAGSAAAVGAVAIGTGQPARPADRAKDAPGDILKEAPAELEYTPAGSISQSVCKWCFGRISLDELCQKGKKMGLRGIDLVGPGKDWDTLKKHGMVGTMTPSHGIGEGLNRKENHEKCLAAIRRAIEATSEAGFPNVVCFSGNRIAGLTDEEGAENCAMALKQVAALAEQKKVTVCLELLNSKVDHKGYMADKTAWGVAVCKKVGSERVKLLYDIYHMQIDEGDVIRTITQSKDYIGHYHTGGVPGRNEIDQTQELYYPAIMRAIVKTGFKGWVAHEFVPKRDPLSSLAQAVRLCDV